jgi:hypothetical protein
MKNRIWVGMNKDRKSYTFTEKLEIRGGLLVGSDGRRLEMDTNMGFNFYPLDIYNLNLKPLEIAEVIIDTDTQKYEVVRPREIGWYLRAVGDVYKDVGVSHWNGENWCRNRKDGCGCHKDSNITIISDKLPDNDYLRSLE